MKAKSILKSFVSYIQSHPDSYDPNIQNAVLYGTDEFKIDYKKRAIKLSSIGWIDCPTLADTDNPDWITLFMMGGKFVLDLGNGNPFDKYKQGYIYQGNRFNLLPLGVAV